MEELHRHGVVPPGWRFTVPPGDPQQGRDVFVRLECFTRHAVKGEPFPGAPKTTNDVGPELTGMGAHHPAAYLAESIVNPNAVIVTGHSGVLNVGIRPNLEVNVQGPLVLADPEEGGMRGGSATACSG
jgi:hypothetical protein